MTQQCGKLTRATYVYESDECQRPASQTCARCQTAVCWQHIRQRCPKGVPTRFGATQHLTAEHAAALRKIEKFTVPQPVAYRQSDAEPPTALIVVNLAYRDAGGRKRNLKTYPGTLLATPEKTWLPDADLSAWLDRVGIEHHGGWTSPEGCVRQLAPATIA